MQHAGVTPKSMHQRWQFGVFIDGFLAGYFQTANMPELEHEESVFNPGGSIMPQKTPGRASVNDVTLEKGIPQGESDEALMQWIQEHINMEEGIGDPTLSYMRDVDVVLFDRGGAELKRVRLKDAWIKTANLGELDGSSSEPTIESITLTYNRFEWV